MRVLHIGREKTWRGGENQMRLLIEGLNQKGVSNFVAYPQGTPAVERLGGIAKVLALPSASLLDPRNILMLKTFCMENEIDVIDAHSSGGHTMALALKKMYAKPQLVVHRRVDNPIKKDLFTKKKYFSKSVAHYICVSEAIQGILKDYGVERRASSIVRDAVDPFSFVSARKYQSKMRFLKKLGLPRDTSLIGNAAAMTDQKGYDVLIPAVRLLKEKGLKFHCVIAGDGVLRKTIEEDIQKNDVADRVTLLGFIDEVEDFISALDILVYPSNNEGLGSLLLDALMAGCCVVATRVGGIPEVVLHEKTGLLSEKGDSVGLSENIEKVLEDRLLRSKLAMDGKSHVCEVFSYDKMVDGTLSIYRRVLSRTST